VKHTLLVTERCNLACDYCYVGQQPSRMPLAVAKRIVDFAFQGTPASEKIEIGFFGGEPLLELGLIRDVVGLIEAEPAFDPERVLLTIVTNGTIFSPEIVGFLADHGIALGISCDGPPEVHDLHRRFHGGGPTAHQVARNIRRFLEAGTAVMVNAVYGPDTLHQLPRTVDHLARLGVRQIYLSPDFSARWLTAHLEALPDVYSAVGAVYTGYALQGDRRFVSLIDGKIAVILRQGYQVMERCRMGRGEFAFTPQGTIYPCERLVAANGGEHRIGDVFKGVDVERLLCHRVPGEALNRECHACGLRDYCMNWCGCSNFFASGFYNRVSPFLCASEKASIRVAFEVFQELEAAGVTFYDHLGGMPAANSLRRQGSDGP